MVGGFIPTREQAERIGRVVTHFERTAGLLPPLEQRRVRDGGATATFKEVVEISTIGYWSSQASGGSSVFGRVNVQWLPSTGKPGVSVPIRADLTTSECDTLITNIQAVSGLSGTTGFGGPFPTHPLYIVFDRYMDLPSNVRTQYAGVNPETTGGIRARVLEQVASTASDVLPAKVKYWSFRPRGIDQITVTISGSDGGIGDGTFVFDYSTYNAGASQNLHSYKIGGIGGTGQIGGFDVVLSLSEVLTADSNGLNTYVPTMTFTRPSPPFPATHTETEVVSTTDTIFTSTGEWEASLTMNSHTYSKTGGAYTQDPVFDVATITLEVTGKTSPWT